MTITCQLCKEDDETFQHFLIDCKFVEDARQPILSGFLRNLNHLIEKHPVNTELYQCSASERQ